jgi:hypothetical protein
MGVGGGKAAAGKAELKGFRVRRRPRVIFPGSLMSERRNNNRCPPWNRNRRTPEAALMRKESEKWLTLHEREWPSQTFERAR